MAVGEDCKLKGKRTHYFIVYKINGTLKQVVKKLGEHATYEDFTA